MSPTVIAALNAQANRELATSHLYLALSYWSDVQHHSGFAKFFATQAEEEEGHAKQFYQFLVDRDVVPAVGPVTPPPAAFTDLISIARLVYDHERGNTAAIHAVYELALAERDYATQVFLQPFIREQVEEEAWTDKLLAKTKQATCGGALFSLDRHLSKELLGE